VRDKVSKMRYDMNQRKTYAIFKCPSCKQKLRAPKGRGKIQVTCSKCHNQFIKKV
jgi:ribosomal protein L37AE/L43A